MSVLINDPFIGPIVQDILRELARSKQLHPRYTTDNTRRAAITVEEGLEAVHEMVHRLEEVIKSGLQAERVGQTNQTRDLTHLRKELVQTAAMCIKHLEALDTESYEAGMRATGELK